MGKINGEKIFQPKKYILYTYNQLHSLIKKNDDPDLANLKFSTTYRFLRDNKDYVGYSKIPHINCLCPECENICLFVQGINKALSNNNNENLPENCHDLIEKISCQPITKLCAENSCPNCPYPEETFEFLNDIELVTFLEWTKDKYYEKKPTFCSGDEAAIKLRDKLKKLKQHYYIKRIQSQEYLHKINNLAESEIIIHIDYSENYKNRLAKDIKKMLTLATINFQFIQPVFIAKRMIKWKYKILD